MKVTRIASKETASSFPGYFGTVYLFGFIPMTFDDDILGKWN
jgi:hypothetical protein